jgi:hypothetical protein
MVTLFTNEKPNTVKQTGSFKEFKIPLIQRGSNLFTFSQAFKNHLDNHLENIIGCLQAILYQNKYEKPLINPNAQKKRVHDT